MPTANSREAGRQAARQAEAAIKKEVAFALRNAVIKSMVQAADEMDKRLAQDMRSAFLDLIKGSQLEAVHKTVGEMAQRSMLGAYDQRVTAREGPASRFDPAYQARKSRLHGKLREALKSPSMVLATETTLGFINVDTLNKAAAHWYRLNFGVGARGADTQAGVFAMAFEGGGQIEFGLGTGPSKGTLVLPPGFWVGPEAHGADAGRRGLDAFYPRGGGGGKRGRPGKVIQTAGIAGRQFFDAGVRRIATELPKAYDNAFREYLATRNGQSFDSVVASTPSVRSRVRVIVKTTTEPARFNRYGPTANF